MAGPRGRAWRAVSSLLWPRCALALRVRRRREIILVLDLFIYAHAALAIVSVSNAMPTSTFAAHERQMLSSAETRCCLS